MQQSKFDSFRYGLASLLVRRPNLRVYASKARWWPNVVQEYGEAVRCRDRLRARGNNKNLLQYYEVTCDELEDELEIFLSGSTGPYQS